jgi:hypothetical protein
MRRASIRAFALVLLVCVAALAAGCASRVLSAPAALPAAERPAPTVNPMFAQRERPAELTPSPVVSGTLSLTEILRRQLVEPTPVATRPMQKIVDVPVFDDKLNSNWTTAHSIGMQSFFTDTKHAYTGSAGIRVTPQQDFGMLLFAVKQNTKEAYGLDRVAGVSLWINSGEQPLDPNNLSVTVVGSNDYIYWRADDKSVELDETRFFSESRLFYLGVQNTVPPNTWVEAVVWLDKLPYEPDYKYVTGIYIKNDEWFRRTFYVDQIHLLVVE